LNRGLPEGADADRSYGHSQDDDRVAISELLRFKERLAVSSWLLLELMHFKRALVEKLGAERGFRAYSRALRDPRAADIPGTSDFLTDADYITSRPIESLRRAASAQAESFVELAPAGEAFAVLPPRVVGEGNHRTLYGVARSVFVTCLTDAYVRGRSSFAYQKDKALLEYQQHELSRIDDQLDFDPGIFCATNDTASVIMPNNDRCSLELDSAFALIGPHTHDFGHWLWEYLPKYIVAKLWGALPAVPLLIDALMPASHREALQMLLPDGVDVITLPAGATARVSRLWCAAGQMYMPVLAKQNHRNRWDYLATPPRRFVPIIEEMRRCIPRASSKNGEGELLYLARKPFRKRKLINYAAIEALARARGFRVVYPEDYDFAEQVRMANAARFLLGPDGSQTFLAFFAKPGSKLCQLSHPYTLGAQVVTGLFEAGGVDVTMFTGDYVNRYAQYTEMSDYEIDEGRFTEFLDDWLDS
jgi:capsular polysaccharide biosynthesis protein